MAILFYSVESEAGNIIEIEFERKMHFIERKSEFLFQKKKNLLQIFSVFDSIQSDAINKEQNIKNCEISFYETSVLQKNYLTLFLTFTIDSKQ